MVDSCGPGGSVGTCGGTGVVSGFGEFVGVGSGSLVGGAGVLSLGGVTGGTKGVSVGLGGGACKYTLCLLFITNACYH